MMMYFKGVFALLVALFSTLVDSSFRQAEILENGDLRKSPVRRLTPPQSRAVESRFDVEARERIDQMFNHQPADQESRVSVNATSPGYWQPTSDCPTPKVWLFLVGKHRAFGNVAPYIAKSMQESSSANCYFVAAVVPVENEIDVQASLTEAQSGVFHGRMSFIILERHGMYERWYPPMTKDFVPPNSYPNQGSMLTRIPHDNETSKMMMRRVDSQNLQPALDVFWWSSHLCAVLAQEAHGIVPMPHSVVLRIRPDVILKRAFDFTNLMLYFEKGQRGKHLAFSGEGWPAFGVQRYQADYFLLTSYQAYETDIAMALEQGKVSTSLSRSNGWGYGWSICGWQLQGSGAQATAAAAVRCAADGGGACGMTIVGPPLEVEQLFSITGDKDHPVQFTNSESKNRPLELYHSDMPLLDPTQNIILYCPVPQEGYSVHRVWLEKMWQGSCSLDGYGPEPMYEAGGVKSFYISGQLHNLMQDGLPREPWPQDC